MCVCVCVCAYVCVCVCVCIYVYMDVCIRSDQKVLTVMFLFLFWKSFYFNIILNEDECCWD